MAVSVRNVLFRLVARGETSRANKRSAVHLRIREGVPASSQPSARSRCVLPHVGMPLPLIPRQLGHSHLSTTGTYLHGISSEEIIATVNARRAPMMHASSGLAL
jgi:hypothetical protein